MVLSLGRSSAVSNSEHILRHQSPVDMHDLASHPGFSRSMPSWSVSWTGGVGCDADPFTGTDYIVTSVIADNIANTIEYYSPIFCRLH